MHSFIFMYLSFNEGARDSVPFICAMKPYAEKFYNSPEWKRTREAYAKSVGRLCEMCKKKGVIRAGEIVHHKVHITPDNINNPEITLAWNNLMCVCRDCHAAIHAGRDKLPYRIGTNGEIIIE